MIRTSKVLKFYFCNHYRTLNVQQDASADEIRRNFSDLAKKYHPDTSETSNEQFLKIKKAYDTLRDPDTRKQYDFELIHGNRSERTLYHYYYPEKTYSKAEQMRLNILGFIRTFGMVVFAFYLMNLCLPAMTDHELRRQNIILANQKIDSSPSTQEKRRKMYEAEMKQKKITSRIVTLKVSDSSRQTSKGKNTRKNCIESIQGIQKEPKAPMPMPTEEYM